MKETVSLVGFDPSRFALDPNLLGCSLGEIASNHRAQLDTQTGEICRDCSRESLAEVQVSTPDRR